MSASSVNTKKILDISHWSLDINENRREIKMNMFDFLILIGVGVAIFLAIYFNKKDIDPKIV